MNNKGFAVSGIIYGLLVLFIIMLIALLAMFNSRKSVLDQLKNKVLNEVGSNIEIKEFKFEELNKLYEYKVLLKGYYNITLNSTNSSTLNVQTYLNAGERLYLKISNNNTEIYSDKEQKKILLRVNNTNYETSKTFNNKYLININYNKNSKTTTSKIAIKYIETTRKNKSLNQVRYIKDCIYGNNVDDTNEWSEIMAIVKGENVALNKNVKIYDINNNEIGNSNYIVDDDLTTKLTTGICVIIDLGRTYNIDYLYSYHSMNVDKKYYDYNLSVSSANIEYKPIYNYEDNNVVVTAFEDPKIKLVGNIYVPIKKIGNDRWIRLYHYNNMSGTVFWNAKAQVLSFNGYDSIHRKSILYYLDTFKKDNKYELLLEYPERDGKKIIRWIQTSDFTKQDVIEGYKKIVDDYSTSNFSGLQLSGNANALITTKDKKHYEIGTLKATDGIYGFDDTLIKGTVDLWIKI